MKTGTAAAGTLILIRRLAPECGSGKTEQAGLAPQSQRLGDTKPAEPSPEGRAGSAQRPRCRAQAGGAGVPAGTRWSPRSSEVCSPSGISGRLRGQKRAPHGLEGISGLRKQAGGSRRCLAAAIAFLSSLSAVTPCFAPPACPQPTDHRTAPVPACQSRPPEQPQHALRMPCTHARASAHRRQANRRMYASDGGQRQCRGRHTFCRRAQARATTNSWNRAQLCSAELRVPGPELHRRQSTGESVVHHTRE